MPGSEPGGGERSKATGDESPRPSHIISPSEVDAWLADSAVRTTTIHRTTAEKALGILEEGIRVELGNPEATWGQGFYSSTKPSPAYGGIRLTVAARVTHPWIVYDTMLAVEALETLMQKHGVGDRRIALLREGYNGVVVHYGHDETWVVVFHDEQVRVVQKHEHG